MLTQVKSIKQIQLHSEFLIEASRNGNVAAVKRLIPKSDPTAQESFALRLAAYNGYTEIVELLIPVSDPKALDNRALQIAANNGHLECVKLLIPVSDPKAHNSCALQLAAQNGHTEIIELLIPNSNYHKVVENFLEDNKDVSLLQQCIENYEALQQQQCLNNELQSVSENKVQSHKRKI